MKAKNKLYPQNTRVLVIKRTRALSCMVRITFAINKWNHFILFISRLLLFIVTSQYEMKDAKEYAYRIKKDQKQYFNCFNTKFNKCLHSLSLEVLYA